MEKCDQYQGEFAGRLSELQSCCPVNQKRCPCETDWIVVAGWSGRIVLRVASFWTPDLYRVVRRLFDPRTFGRETTFSRENEVFEASVATTTMTHPRGVSE
jgi:hypothetical protein